MYKQEFRKKKGLDITTIQKIAKWWGKKSEIHKTMLIQDLFVKTS